MGRSSSQLFRALASAQHLGDSVGPRVAMNLRMRHPVPRADMPVRTSQAGTLSVDGLANETSRERATGIEPA
jgi:hypothetical protein